MNKLKRKIEESVALNGSFKKRALSDDEAKSSFRPGLFDAGTLESYTKQYNGSEPYKHGVIKNLIDSALLRKVREEILEHISFTPKETDIYKIHQSGDLANLDGLDDSALRRLPSLLKLRDALYSSAFRKYISHIAHAGPLSGTKTDMAVNVYTPSCHLLCHDDVIGSRRISYILYLLDPDRPWSAEWGGALRLYPTEDLDNGDGSLVKVPTPEYTAVIPPAFNQLSFFTVQPGESFHDVEEVYRRPKPSNEDDGGRIRMAISGWFHIPQDGEEGFEEGLEAKLAERSSLKQLESKADKFDLPQPDWRLFNDEDADMDSSELTEDDLNFLIKYMSPAYLIPDTVGELSSTFEDESSLRLSKFLHPNFAARLKLFIEAAEQLPDIPAPVSEQKCCGVACPPHKHRFLYRKLRDVDAPAETPEDQSPYDELLNCFFPSESFRKWLSLATSLNFSKGNILARRFRRGSDYTLATIYDEPEPQLEICLGITPTLGWDDDEADDNDDDLDEMEEDRIPPKAPNGPKARGKPNDMPACNQATQTIGPSDKEATTEEESVGGYEVYMAGDDDEEYDPAVPAQLSSTTKGSTSGNKNTGAGARVKADPAVYRTGGDDEDDGALFYAPAAWNSLSVVLRDKGVLRFVKYVSQAAKGDRWDVLGEFGVAPDEDDE